MQNETAAFITYQKLSDALLWLWIVIFAAVYKFLKWFSLREYNLFLQKLESRMHKDYLALSKRLDVIESKQDSLAKDVHAYKKNKHDILNENIALNSAMNICNEALTKALKIIEDEKR